MRQRVGLSPMMGKEKENTMARTSNLTKDEQTRKNAEYEALKNAAIAHLQAMPEHERNVIAQFAVDIKALTLPGGQYYDEATFYHVMDACKQAYYSKVKPGNGSSVAELAPVVSKARLEVTPTPTGNIVRVNGEIEQPKTKKVTRKSEKARADDDVLSQVLATLQAVNKRMDILEDAVTAPTSDASLLQETAGL